MRPLKGFTLIELLVVVAIIMLLVSVLADVLRKADKEEEAKVKVATEVQKPRRVAPVVEVELPLDEICPPHQRDFSAGRYYEIPPICYDRFGITDAMVDMSMEKMRNNPCNN